MFHCLNSPFSHSICISYFRRMDKTVYGIKLKDIKGQELDLSQYKGKKILLVNTASECGYTGQYAPLEELANTYKDTLAVIGLPSNDFGGQEPGTEQEIAKFCEVNYGVTFPLTTKIKILEPGIHPLYQFLTKKDLNGYADSEVKWNFQKYLCDENGRLIAMFPHNMEPVDEQIINAIEKKANAV